jgi:hypothetical protein
MNPTTRLFPSTTGNPFADGSSFFPGAYRGNTPLERAIIDRARGTITSHRFGPPQIDTDLGSLTRAIDSAFVLIPRDAVPTIERATRSDYARSFHFPGNVTIGTAPDITAEQARKKAAAWVAVAAKLEGEEKAAADKAKAEADAEQAAAAARSKRLDELAAEYFADDFMNLGARKARVIEDTYKLELQLADKADDCGCDE